MKTNWSINRRTFLRGLAGAAMPLPFLNLMERSADAGVVNKAGESTPPVRFMSLFKPNGVYPPSWNINDGTEHDFRMSPLMAPFAKHKDDLLILDNMGNFGFSAHVSSTRRFLSGHHENKKQASMDQILADHIGKGTRHRSLELTTEGLFSQQAGCSYISYGAGGEFIPRESDPQLIFDRLFRDPLDIPSQRNEMSSILDRVRDDARSLLRKAGREDKETLDEYLTVVRETEKRIELMNAKQGESALNVADIPRPPLAANLDEQVETMIDLIALAMWTDSTRCATYMLGNSNSRMIFDFLGVKEQHHFLSHFFRNFSRENLDALLKVSLWHMEKFDYLLNRLKSYKDHHGSLLDHSVVLFGSGMGHSDNHTVQRVPTILAGKGGGMLKTGRYLRYAENQELGSLHLALMQGYGVPIKSYANSSTPLQGLDGNSFNEYREQPFDSWIRLSDGKITVQGRLVMSDNLDEAKTFYVQVKGKDPVRVDVDFRNFQQFNMPYHVGTPVAVTGNRGELNGQLQITKISELKSVFGKDAP